MGRHKVRTLGILKIDFISFVRLVLKEEGLLQVNVLYNNINLSKINEPLSFQVNVLFNHFFEI